MHCADATRSYASPAGRPEGFGDPPVRPAYLQGRYEPFLAMLHAATEPSAGLGVVICPPFGWEEMCSYRPRREWAQLLAQKGIAVLRLDLPGCGDSGGYPTDEGRVDAWTDAIATATVWLRHESGCRRVIAIGVGAGGLLAYRAAAQEAPIDDLVLWGTPARGSRFIRELRSFARMEAAQRAEGEQEDRLPPDWLAAGGYVITKQTRSDLDALDLRELELPAAARRRVLLLERDGISVDSELLDSLRRQQVDVDTMAVKGYGDMMVEPQFASLPLAAVVQIDEWIGGLDPAAAPERTLPPPCATSSQAQLTAADGTAVRESLLAIPYAKGDMFAVLTQPVGRELPLAALLLGGTGHRIGPNRMWVEIARRWAASHGVTTVRLDVTGAGDADGVGAPDVPSLYTTELVDQVRCTLKAMTGAGLPPRTVVVGLCAGAYWAMHASLTAPADVVPLMVNPSVMAWDDSEHVDRMARHYMRQLGRRAAWRRMFGGESTPSQIRDILLHRVAAAVLRLLGRGPQPTSADDSDGILDALRDEGVPALMLFTGRETLYEEFQREGRLQRLGRWPNLRLELIPGRSDLHTLRPIWLQREVHELLDDALLRELGENAPAREPGEDAPDA